MWRFWYPLYCVVLRTTHFHIGWLWRKGPKARRAWLTRLRVYAAKRDPYPEEEWAWKK